MGGSPAHLPRLRFPREMQPRSRQLAASPVRFPRSSLRYAYLRIRCRVAARCLRWPVPYIHTVRPHRDATREQARPIARRASSEHAMQAIASRLARRKRPSSRFHFAQMNLARARPPPPRPPSSSVRATLQCRARAPIGAPFRSTDKAQKPTCLSPTRGREGDAQYVADGRRLRSKLDARRDSSPPEPCTWLADHVPVDTPCQPRALNSILIASSEPSRYRPPAANSPALLSPAGSHGNLVLQRPGSSPQFMSDGGDAAVPTPAVGAPAHSR
ncbi:hypothetical protein DAEQUDRAFT_481019 [Daedalea quercina L-15889]|uniref:Uncharacterized protein n=1 Tax=Daedalea quercina L-15889 TaxID=1314783 RepID=A0A165MTQ7_9APHY|nr:hypothetical protein DAEQUDRAFT_481019 [Daedalea quercina L-15889]